MDSAFEINHYRGIAIANEILTGIVAAGNGQSVNAHVIRRRIAGAGERALRGKLGQPTNLLNSAANFETWGIQLELKGQRCFACAANLRFCLAAATVELSSE